MTEETKSEYGERKLDERSNWQRVKDYCAKNKISVLFFNFYDLWKFNKSGTINLIKTHKATAAWLDKCEARRKAKAGSPHVCDLLQTLEEEAGQTFTTRQQRRAFERRLKAAQERKYPTCHVVYLNEGNHDQRHEQRSRLRAANLNFFTKTLTKGGDLKGPRKLRKSVVRWRMSQMVSNPPVAHIEGGIQGEMVDKDAA